MYIYIYTYVYLHMYTYVRMYVCMYVWMYVQYVFGDTGTVKYLHAYIRTHIPFPEIFGHRHIFRKRFCVSTGAQ